MRRLLGPFPEGLPSWFFLSAEQSGILFSPAVRSQQRTWAPRAPHTVFNAAARGCLEASLRFWSAAAAASGNEAPVDTSALSHIEAKNYMKPHGDGTSSNLSGKNKCLGEETKQTTSAASKVVIANGCSLSV